MSIIKDINNYFVIDQLDKHQSVSTPSPGVIYTVFIQIEPDNNKTGNALETGLQGNIFKPMTINENAIRTARQICRSGFSYVIFNKPSIRV